MTNSKQYIEFEKHKSDMKNITIGVPQGSILGPLFFIIDINDIVLAPKIFTPIIYAAICMLMIQHYLVHWKILICIMAASSLKT